MEMVADSGMDHLISPPGTLPGPKVSIYLFTIAQSVARGALLRDNASPEVSGSDLTGADISDIITMFFRNMFSLVELLKKNSMPDLRCSFRSKSERQIQSAKFAFTIVPMT